MEYPQTNSISPYEPAIKVYAAQKMAEAISFSLDRKYLQNIVESDIAQLKVTPSGQPTKATWIRINQIGKPLEDNTETCFSAIQKILYACHEPRVMQFLFLVTGNGIENHLYIGIRSISKSLTEARYLSKFIKGIWPGVDTTIIAKEDEDPGLCALKESIRIERNNKKALGDVFAITGIPSIENQYEGLYPATIDKLIAGMGNTPYAYLVVADAIAPENVDQILFSCRDLNGQAESLKSINVSEGVTLGTTDQYGTTDTKNWSIGKSDSNQRNIGSAVVNIAEAGISMIFPQIAPIVSALHNTGIDGAIAGLIGQSSTSTSEQKGEAHSVNESHSNSESKNQGISRNIINKHIEAIATQLGHHTERLETGKAIGLWNVGTYFLSSINQASNGARQLRSILSGNESFFEPIRIHNITDILEEEFRVNEDSELSYRSDSLGQLQAPCLWLENKSQQRFKHPLGDQFNQLRSVLTTKELSYLVNFPLRTVPGISVIDSSAEFSLNKLEESEKTSKFGKLINGGTTTNMDYNLSIDSLSKHTLLCGINGTGKTNTVQSILNSIDGKIPFLIIEPAKTEYVDWAIEYNKKHSDKPISIYIPGCKSYKDRRNNGEAVALKQLRLNPFEPVWLSPEQDPNVLSHIDRLKSTFAAAFPMYDILPVLMEDLIYTLYSNKTTNWLGEDPQYGVTKAPTLNGMMVYAEKVIHNCGYEKQVEANMKACMNTRIKSLLRGWKKNMLGCSKSTDWKELFEKPCVINLSYVGDDVDKAFFMALILQFMYEYRQALAEIGETDFNSNTCRHLTIIEEAHRVMMKCDNPDMPQYKSAMMFSNMLSEIRAYGEGMLLVDQVPTRLVPDAIKNTNTKICHRMVSEDDCRAIAESMGISDEQKKMIPKLLVGQCIVSTSLSTDKHWVQVNKVK